MNNNMKQTSMQFIFSRPNLYISSKVAKHTNQEDDYMKLRGINDEYAKKIMLDYLQKFENLLLDKLPDVLDNQQKKIRLKTIYKALKKRV